MPSDPSASAKKTIDQLDVAGMRVLVRLDLNVPLDDTGKITDDRRIRAALPTLKKLLAGGGRLILMSHLGRPTGSPESDTAFTLRPVATRLSELLDIDVAFAADCIGADVEKLTAGLRYGGACLLENLRFNQAETIKDKKAAEDQSLRDLKNDFAANLAKLGDCYVNDAFGTCHRDNASMLTLPAMLKQRGAPCVAGYLVAAELKFLGETLANPNRPFVAILGGAKVSDKVGAIENLLDKCDKILIGGAMAYTFAAAAGQKIGKSLTEPDKFDLANNLRNRAGDKLLLPIDSIAAPDISSSATTRHCDDAIPDDLMGLDIGPKTIAAYRDAIASAKTIVWNGPLGVFETPPFDAGTVAVANAVADATDNGAVSIVGGGDSAAAIEAAGLSDRVTHVSTGGGASLEFLEGKRFAAIDILDDA
jgi:phosphoglycerate kinase